MKNVVLFTLSLLVTTSFGQFTLTLQPGPEEGKDAFLDSRVSDYMGGNHFDFLAAAWTHGGDRVDVRSILEFDLSAIDSTYHVITASLFFYGYESPSNTGHSAAFSGSNSCYLQRIVSPWNEATVSWDTKPEVTTEGQISLPGSTSENQDYEIDVTEIVAEMVANPSENYGFQLRLQIEETYNSILFASSDNDNPAIRPKLVVEYEREELNVEAHQLVYNLGPNPTVDVLNIRFNDNASALSVELINDLGQVVLSERSVNADLKLDVSHLASGLYFLKVRKGDAVDLRKIIVQRQPN